jgi:hypothetical protein
MKIIGPGWEQPYSLCFIKSICRSDTVMSIGVTYLRSRQQYEQPSPILAQGKNKYNVYIE